MDNCLSTWRMTIGLFYNGTHGVSSYCTINHYPIYTFLFILGLFQRHLINIFIKSIYFLNRFKNNLVTVEFCIILLLLLCDLYYSKCKKVDRFYNCMYCTFVSPSNQVSVEEYVFSITVLKLLLSNEIEFNPGPNENEAHCLSVFHQNIRSIRNKLDYINDFFLDFGIFALHKLI